VTDRNLYVHSFFLIIFFVLIISLTSISVFADGYEPDEAIINETLIQAKHRAEEFSKWVLESNFGDPYIELTIGHAGDITSTVFTPDGEYGISGSKDQTIKIWEIKTGKRIKNLSLHSQDVTHISISSNGKYVLSRSGSSYGTEKLIVWEFPSGKIVHTLKEIQGELTSLNISNDGKTAITSSYVKYPAEGINQNQFSIWNLSTGEQINNYTNHHTKIVKVLLTPDEKYTLSIYEDGEMQIRNFNNYKLIRKLNIGKINRNFTNRIRISPDGTYLLVDLVGGVMQLVNIETGQKIPINVGLGVGKFVTSIEFSRDGRNLYVGSWMQILVFDISLLKVVKRYYSTERGSIESMAVSYNGNYLLAGTDEGALSCYDLTSNSLKFHVTGNKNSINRISSTTNGSMALLSSDIFEHNPVLRLWDIEKGKVVSSFGTQKVDAYSGYEDECYLTALSNNGKYLIRVMDKNTKIIELVNTATGKILKTFKGNIGAISSLTFTSDDKYFISGSSDGTAKLWDIISGKEIRIYLGSNDWLYDITISPDNKFFFARSHDDKKIYQWNITSGQLVNSFWQWRYPSSFTISPNGKSICIASIYNSKGVIQIININSGDIIKEWNATCESLRYSQNGKFIISYKNYDQHLDIWNADTGLLKNNLDLKSDIITFSTIPNTNLILISLENGSIQLRNSNNGNLIYTAVANSKDESFIWTPEGYFAGNENYAKKYVSVVDDLSTQTIDQFFDTYYRPDIIQAIITGKNITELIGNNRITDNIAPTPEVTIKVEQTNGTFRSITNTQNNYKITDGSVNVKVTATDQGGGAEEIRLFHNGVRASGTSRGLAVVSNGDTITQTFTIQLTDGQNSLRALAFTSTRIESTPIVIAINYNAPVKVEPTLWVLAVGINEYKNSRYNLNYAVNDADSFIGAVKKSGDSLFKSIETTLLTDKKATRQGIIDALEKITARAKPEDVFMFFYAGHGIALESAETERTEFFFIPTDVTQMTDLTKVMDLGLAGPEFEILVSSIPARKQFLVLDACNSGAINSAFGVRGAAEEIALSRLSRATGSALIAASRDDQFAQEFEALGQGALTKALLDGLDGDAAQENGQITVGSLKGYVESALPGLTEQYAGQAQYPTGFVFGQDFPIGVK
jgi:WD40 repeat protein